MRARTPGHARRSGRRCAIQRRYHDGMSATVVIAVSDLMFAPRIEDAARALGLTTAVVTDATALDAALATGAAMAVVDLHDTGFVALDAIVAAKGAGARVLAFGRHTEPQTLRAARDAGADRVVPRSQLVEELGALLADLIAGK